MSLVKDVSEYGNMVFRRIQIASGVTHAEKNSSNQKQSSIFNNGEKEGQAVGGMAASNTSTVFSKNVVSAGYEFHLSIVPLCSEDEYVLKLVD
ncbi:hypothetical protein KIN20_028477 [Parelaphostrongylus tenuis]|uniref:Uncharacterized protein n=1 Tax=Parelaphostrongylus tenuis TaxID=148309 RepID=A0AAD5R0X4_PARTN|nr:hypothetical protein KIN20_028477 [Parelaphostrongylus tenuis]